MGRAPVIAMEAGFVTGALEGGGEIRTPDQRLRVFVSSTLAELAPERAAVSRTIPALGLSPVLSSWALGAAEGLRRRAGLRSPSCAVSVRTSHEIELAAFAGEQCG